MLVLTCCLPITAVSSSPSNSSGTTIAELDSAPSSQQPLVLQQAVPQNPQGAATNTSNTANTRDVNLLSSSSYIDSIGSLHVVGELQNTSPESPVTAFLIAL